MPSIADRVRETSTSTGTGVFSLAGAVTGFQAFSEAFASATDVYYCITNGTDWEVGHGAVTTGSPWTLARSVVLASSNADALVDFPAGIKDVFNVMPATALEALILTVAQETHAATSKATPVDADEMPLADSAASFGLKKLTWANLKATLATYFNTLYLAIVAPGVDGNVLRSNGTSWASAAPLFTDIDYPAALKIGNPAHVDTLQELFNHMESAGVVDGCAVTNNGDGTISIAAGTALLRSAADAHTDLYVCSVTAQGPLALTNNSINWVYVNYNAGVPTWQTSTSQTSFDCLDKCIGYTVFRDGTRLNVIDAREQNVDGNRKTRQLFLSFSRFIHAEGGTTLGGTGLALTVTAGQFFFMLQALPHGAFDTSVAGTANANTFDLWYRDGAGGWTRTADQKVINSTVYDGNTGTPVSLGGTARHGVSWVYIVHDGPSALQVVMGQVSYSNASNADVATPPAGLPPELAAHGSLIGFVVYKNAGTSFVSVHNAFTQLFATSTPTDHNELANLQGGQALEYYHLTAAQHTDLTDGGDSALHYHSADRATVTTIGTLIHGATNKTTPIDADEFGIYDSVSGLLNRLSLANLKTTIAAYYNTLTATLTNKTLTEPILGGNTTHTATSDVATLGTERTTNGTFTGSATGWTLGTNWAYGTDNVILTLSVAVEGTLSQNISVTSGESYLVEWSQTNSIANNGTIRPSIGSVNGLYVCPTSIVSATMSQVVVAAASGTVALTFTPTDITSTGTITIDTVTVKQITPITATLTLKDTTGAIQYEDRVARVTNNGNTLNGLNAGKFIITGHSNSFNGASAGYSNTTGSFNNFSGYQSGYSNTTGINNNFSGYQSGYSNTIGTNNNFSGYQSGYSNTTGGNNNFSGYQSGYLNTTGVNNNFSGVQSGYSNTTGNSNNFYGLQSGFSNTTGNSNNFSGYQSGYSNTTGGFNNFSGLQSGYSNTTGSFNNFSGYQSGYSNTTGGNNSFVGYLAGYNNTTGSNNTADGLSSLNDLAPTAKAITAFADYSGTVAGTVKATCVGHGRTTADSLIVSGTVNYNGTYSVTVIDVDNFYFTKTFVATEAGWWTLSGFLASNNTAIGYNTGRGITTGSGNTIIGASVTGLSANLTNNIIIANSAGTIKAQHDSTNWTFTGGASITGDLVLSKTVTAAGTTGAQTINKTSGSVNFAATATSLVVTNSLVSTTSIIQCTVSANDTTMKSVAIVAVAGSFTIYANAAATAETRVNFTVTN